jgi:hypothetical protein
MSSINPITVRDGDLLVKGPNAVEFHVIDWDSFIPASATIVATSIVVALARFSGDTATDASRLAALVVDEATIVSSRVTQMRVSAGALGAKYSLTNRITMDDGQVERRSYSLLIQQG